MQYGYPTDKGCELCGAKPAYIDPRYLYVVCEEHHKIPPVKFQMLKELLITSKEINHANI
jgi:hypothetical protein